MVGKVFELCNWCCIPHVLLTALPVFLDLWMMMSSVYRQTTKINMHKHACVHNRCDTTLVWGSEHSGIRKSLCGALPPQTMSIPPPHIPCIYIVSVNNVSSVKWFNPLKNYNSSAWERETSSKVRVDYDHPNIQYLFMKLSARISKYSNIHICACCVYRC